MSIRFVAAIWELEDDKLSATQRLLLLALADHAGPDGDHIYPSRQRLAKMCGCTRRTVSRNIQALENLGYVRRVARQRSDGGQRANEYRLTIQFTCTTPHPTPPVGRDTPPPDTADEGTSLNRTNEETYVPSSPSNDSEDGLSDLAGGQESDAPPYDEIRKYWNEHKTLGESPLKVVKLGRRRRTHLRARWKERLFRREWRRLFDLCEESTFLSEKWRNFSFDWVIANGENYAKILEERYADRDSGPGYDPADWGIET
ncbi:MAG: helix-turn-helix domain-containing protein [Planctomycetota bacterium]